MSTTDESFSRKVLTASGQWISPWCPPHSDRHEVGGIEFYVLDGRAVLMNASAVTDCKSLVGMFSSVARASGARRMQITVGPGLLNEIDVQELLTLGARIIAVTDILAIRVSAEAGRAMSVPDEISTAEVETRDQLATFLRTSHAAWGYPEPSDDEIDASHRDLRSGSFTAFWDGVPVGTGGYTLVDDVARFWGTAVRPEYRNRGVYRALVRARLESADVRSARMALVHADPTTSSPILRTLGFARYGVRTTVEMDC